MSQTKIDQGASASRPGARASHQAPSGLDHSASPPRAADFTVAELLAWARTKPANERYDFTNSRICALAQFGRATNRAHLIGPDGTAALCDWPELQDAMAGGAETFGALVERLEALSLTGGVTQSDWASVAAYMADLEQVSA
jgi:hypothetical protein